MDINLNVLRKNIYEYSYQMLLETYPALARNVIKFSLDEISEDGKHAVGEFVIKIRDKIMTIPILYREGNVDAISYIGEQDSGKFLFLTKKLYDTLVNVLEVDFGDTVSPKNVDKGIIGRLFATPMTFSIKTASIKETFNKLAGLRNQTISNSESIIEKIASEDANFYSTLKQVCNSNEKIASIIKDIVDFKTIGLKHSIEKTASFIEEYKKPKVYTSIKEISVLNPLEKEAAAREIATDGFYMKGSRDSSITRNNYSIAEILKLKYNVNTFETVNNSGVYHLYKKNFDNVLGISAVSLFEPTRNYIITSKEDNCLNKMNIVGTKIKTSSINETMAYVSSILPELSEEDFKDKTLLFVDNDSTIKVIFGDYTKVSNGDIICTQTYIPSLVYNLQQVVITDSVNKTVLNKEVLYVPKDRVFMVNYLHRGTCEDFITFEELDNVVFEKVAEISYKNYKFYLGNDELDKRGAIEKLANMGGNKETIKEIIKEAASKPSIEIPIYEINQKIDLLIQQNTQQNIIINEILKRLQDNEKEIKTIKKQFKQLSQPQPTSTVNDTQNAELIQAIIQLSEQIGINGKELIARAQKEGIPMDQVYNYLAEYAQNQSQQSSPSIQGQDQQIQQQTAPVNTQNNATNISSPNDLDAIPTDEQIQQDEEKAPPVDENGYLIDNLDIETIELLKRIADTKILESAIVSYLANLDNPSFAIKNQLEKIKEGVFSLAITMLMAEINYYELSKNVSTNVLDSFINKGKSLGRKMTDFVLTLEEI